MNRIKTKVEEIKNKVIIVIKSESGQLPELSWQAGAAALGIIIIVALIVYMPDKIVEVVGDIIDWAMGEVGM